MFLLKIISIILPWKIKRFILIKYFDFEIHPSSRIGIAWVFPGKLYLGKNSKIGHFTTAIHLDIIKIGDNSTIGRNNWITGFPSDSGSEHYKHQPERISELIMGNESAITKNHHIDCTNRIVIGNFVTIAGYNSQLLTHSIDVFEGRQNSKPITIGDYTFIGTNVVILGGAKLPAYSVLGAKSLLSKSFDEEWTLYAGVPAKPVKNIPKDAKYFRRESGFVY